MPIDNILYGENLTIGIDVMNTGSASNILFKESEIVNINITNTGILESILFIDKMIVTMTLICLGNTYSRSRVVNT